MIKTNERCYLIWSYLTKKYEKIPFDNDMDVMYKRDVRYPNSKPKKLFYDYLRNSIKVYADGGYVLVSVCPYCGETIETYHSQEIFKKHPEITNTCKYCGSDFLAKDNIARFKTLRISSDEIPDYFMSTKYYAYSNWEWSIYEDFRNSTYKNYVVTFDLYDSIGKYVINASSYNIALEKCIKKLKQDGFKEYRDVKVKCL